MKASSEFCSMEDFRTHCRAIFRSYTPLHDRARSIDDRFARFIVENAKRPGQVRYHILERLRRYDLSSIVTHEPMLNREIPGAVLNKLNRISREATESLQGELPLSE